jgi:hypothetical protein
VVWCSVKKTLAQGPSLGVTIDFSGKFDAFCHRKCDKMPEKCPRTTHLRKLMIRDHEWFRELVDQVHKIRGVAVGGILKGYIKEREKENLLREPGDEELLPVAEQLYFGWKQNVIKYRKIMSLNVK